MIFSNLSHFLLKSILVEIKSTAYFEFSTLISFILSLTDSNIDLQSFNIFSFISFIYFICDSLLLSNILFIELIIVSNLSLYIFKSIIFFSLYIFNLAKSLITSKKKTWQFLYLAQRPIYPGSSKLSKYILSYFCVAKEKSFLIFVSLTSCETNFSFVLVTKVSYSDNWSNLEVILAWVSIILLNFEFDILFCELNSDFILSVEYL